MPALSAFKLTLPWPDPIVPEYKSFELGRWRLKKYPANGLYGYWLPTTNTVPGFMLQRKEKGTWNTWMSVTAMELQSHQPHIASAFGNVVVAGLGMGMFLRNILGKPEVKAVVVLEKDEQVIKMFDRICDWKSWPGASKLLIVQRDAMNWKPPEGQTVHFLYADIWKTLGSDIAYLQVQTMQSNIRAQAVGYWGQELDFATFCQQNGILPAAVSMADFKLFRDFMGLPLIGMADENYPRLCMAAVALQAAQSCLKSNPAQANQLTMIALGLAGAFKAQNKIEIESEADAVA